MTAISRPGFRILIVDDNEAIHADLRKILIPSQDTGMLDEDESFLFGATRSHSIDFEIDSAFQGQQGLEKVEQAVAADNPYALVFVDIRMPPGWDGIETVARIWECDPDIQVVVCTAYADYSWHDIMARLGRSNGLVILKKPFDPIEVLQLAYALTSKWEGERKIRKHVAELDQLVEQRTLELMATVKELEIAKQRAETDAFEDPLTKLPNRRLFMQRLEEAIGRSRLNPQFKCAVLYLDIDRFKIVNDSLGHFAGDDLLVEIASRLKKWLREGNGRISSEDVIARIGGDEFAVLLQGIRSAGDAVLIAERLGGAISNPISVRGKEVAYTASFGVVTSESEYADCDSMMRDADSAMYRAKEAGGGCVVLFDESMHRSNLDRLHKESEIRQALERNEFFLCYQPIVSLKTSRIESAEALLRWQSPTRGLVNPIDFIPLSEETGLIIPIGKWSIACACRQVHDWYAELGAARTPSVSVNLSARQFLQPDLVRSISEAIDESGIRSESIRFELTETVTMRDPRQTVIMLRQLQELGVRLSIDDFGTGYSSLNYLHRFSVDTLKIDKSFVQHMESDDRSLMIVKTIINLARNLRMRVVAEGVETRGQVAMLSDLNCDFVQGFYFSKPVGPQEFAKLLQSNEPFKPESDSAPAPNYGTEAIAV